ncbi:rho guanyl-nucleotide exchange factor 1 [Perilla frutescens var. hirtella]|nr:rho guanyl-nucleotide exchange factor 1 [Perilla frutescens var. hirtella]
MVQRDGMALVPSIQQSPGGGAYEVMATRPRSDFYRCITVDEFSPECLLDYMDFVNREHHTLDVANRIEAAVHVWKMKEISCLHLDSITYHQHTHSSRTTSGHMQQQSLKLKRHSLDTSVDRATSFSASGSFAIDHRIRVMNVFVSTELHCWKVEEQQICEKARITEKEALAAAGKITETRQSFAFEISSLEFMFQTLSEEIIMRLLLFGTLHNAK